MISLCNYCKFAISILKLNSRLTLEKIVDSILKKSRKLVEERNSLSKENNELKDQILNLKEKSSSQNLRINELIEKQKIQHIAGIFGKEEKRTSLNKIDEVVREVDRCIALLNT